MCRRVFAWEPSTEEVPFFPPPPLTVPCRFLTLPLLIAPPTPRQRVLLWMLPLEVWQQVLGFCPFEEYARLVGLRGGGDKGERSLCWWSSRTASREFYLVLKHSLLEMRFDRVLPSAWLGGLWQASRTWEGKHIKTLRLGELPFP